MMGNEQTALQVRPSGAIAEADSFMSEEQVLHQVAMIQRLMKSVLHDKEHYGTIPGCGEKPALLKPGAEKLAMMFRLAPSYDIQVIEMAGGHREYRIKTSLNHVVTQAFLGEGVGTCTTMETKYRFRKAEQTCPECGEAAIIKGKQEYGGGWLCYKKRGGCGAKFKDGDSAIENQEMGRIEHDNPADYYNTCLKMGKKRSLVDAILTATAASDIFTQDIEEAPELFGGKPAAEPAGAEPERPPQSATPPPPEPEKGHGIPSQSQPPAEVGDDPIFRQRAEIQEWGMRLTNGNVGEYENILRNMTSFKDKKTGDIVQGVDDVARLKGTRLEIAHHKMHQEFDRAFGETPNDLFDREMTHTTSNMARETLNGALND